MLATATKQPEPVLNHYELLGLRPFETDSTVIEAQVRSRLRELRKYQVGPRAADACRQMEQIAAATACLTDPLQKRHYDDALRIEFGLPPISVTASFRDAPADHRPAGIESSGSVRPSFWVKIVLTLIALGVAGWACSGLRL